MNRYIYSLRTLLILMAIGPPLLAAAWTNRESLLAARPPAEVYFPKYASQKLKAKLREREALRQKMHYVAGAGSVLLYPIAVFLLALVVRSMRRWSQPPKPSPMTWASIATSALAAIFVLAFFLTFPPPWGHTSWAAYFDAQSRGVESVSPFP